MLGPGKPPSQPSRSRVVRPPSETQSSLIVAVRVRPLLLSERAKGNRKDILRVIDGRVVVVLDPDESKDYLDQRSNRTKEKSYTFDYAYDVQASTREIYDGSIHQVVSGVMNGINGTVFAYGATGSGKTYSMVGSADDRGLMILSLESIFKDMETIFSDEQTHVVCSYLEVYNEVIYDLLLRNSGALELREDPNQGVQVAGLRRIRVKTAEEIMSLLEEGNKRRKMDSTEANAVSSRSHAVLEIIVKRTPKNRYRSKQLRGKLSLVDLAGSERAAETNNAGQKLRDGANINRSLLALANCINALGKQKKRGMAYVPYRNSKLTRLLKDGLSGNCRTAMIATVAASSDQYHHSINTLKYADRAKEIKTHVVQNVGTVESHISDYQRIIDNLQAEVQNLRSQLHERSSFQGAQPAPGEADQIAWIDALATEINENVEERVNLQKALFELEDLNVCNKFELKNVEDHLSAGCLSKEDQREARERRQNILESIRENEEAGLRYRADIQANEEARRCIQKRIDERMDQHGNASFLKILSSFRLQAVRLQELQFQMAIRDQIISEQRSVISHLWRVLEASGLDKESVLEIAYEQGILMEGFMPEGEGPPTVGASHLVGMIASEKEGAPYLGRVGKELANKQSIEGERAKYRYSFWSKYNPSENADSVRETSSETSEAPYQRSRAQMEQLRRARSATRDDNSIGVGPASKGAMPNRGSARDQQTPDVRRHAPQFGPQGPPSTSGPERREWGADARGIPARHRASEGDEAVEEGGFEGRGDHGGPGELVLEGAGIVADRRKAPRREERVLEHPRQSAIVEKLQRLKGRVAQKMASVTGRRETRTPESSWSPSGANLNGSGAASFQHRHDAWMWNVGGDQPDRRERQRQSGKGRGVHQAWGQN